MSIIQKALDWIRSSPFLDEDAAMQLLPTVTPQASMLHGTMRVDERNPEYCAYLVDLMVRIITANRGYPPKTRGDLVVTMMRIAVERYNRILYYWWIPINHPLVEFLESHARFYDDAWSERELVATETMGRVWIYHDDIIQEMMSLLHDIFDQHGVQLEPAGEVVVTEEDEEEEEEEEEEDNDAPHIIIDSSYEQKPNGTKKLK